MTNKVYLGDSVYVEIEDYRIKLTTENGYGVTNEIFLDFEVFKRLVEITDKKNNICDGTNRIKYYSDKLQCPECGNDYVVQICAQDYRYSSLGSPAIYKCSKCGCNFNFDDGCTG